MFLRKTEGGSGYEGDTSGAVDLAPLFKGGEATPFAGKTKNYIIDTYRSNHGNKGSFLEISEYAELVDTIVDLYLRVYPNRDRNLSIERVKKSLSHPRTYIELVRYGDEPVGFGIFPRLIVSGRSLFYSSRAFLEDHERQHLGTHVLEEGIHLHQEELSKSGRVLRWGALMTHNPWSLVSLESVPKIEDIFPFGRKGEEPKLKLYSQYPEALTYLAGVYYKVGMHRGTMNWITGVATGELKDEGMNENIRVTREHERAWELQQLMVLPPPEGLGMNREAGDEAIVLFRFKHPFWLQ